jgi:hypothetical protein
VCLSHRFKILTYYCHSNTGISKTVQEEEQLLPVIYLFIPRLNTRPLPLRLRVVMSHDLVRSVFYAYLTTAFDLTWGSHDNVTALLSLKN